MTDSPAMAAEQARRIDTSVPQTARVWNYWLGGKDNYAVDRKLGDEVEAAFPEMVALARASRAFLTRAVRYLAGEAGIRQFLDVGTGLPTADNTHEVAQAVDPTSRIVYVDSDPLVLVHARALLTSAPEGRTDYVEADLRDPDRILQEAGRALDLSQPVALILGGILGHIESHDEARSLVARLLAPLPSGSYLLSSDGSNTSEGVVEAARIWNLSANPRYHVRSPRQIAAYFDGLMPVEPGIVSVAHWRPDTAHPVFVDTYGGVARKP
ncbi:SAM-dependent methyltransferase [Salinispora arenicola]|uniref:SAM-dependent methyltransferase n=1 Tax=Salinispora arenicola TaxID=168697 RepID=UPI001431AEAF|nr:SAM-dependent methyltransferase [Salinispora arenicola]NIL43533.1 SAM-dependent methyltransferase [Salinispora arenicola]